MGELAARRRARDLWVSRSHLLAAATGAVVLSLVTFALGYALGRGEEAPAARGALVAGADDGALLELLARVEANTAVDGGVDELTFPDALKGDAGGGDAVPPQGPAAPPVGKVQVPADAVAPPEADPRPAGRYTLTVLRTDDPAAAKAERDRLRAAGLDAWLGAELVDGRPAWRVAIGGHPSEEAAAKALPDVAAHASGATVEPL